MQRIMDLREIDALVAEKVMGRTVDRIGPDVDNPIFVYGDCGQSIEIPKYSTDIAAAWEVVERFTEVFRLERRFDGGRQIGWWVELYDGSEDHDCGSAFGDSPSQAICLAALKAKGINMSEWEK